MGMNYGEPKKQISYILMGIAARLEEIEGRVRTYDTDVLIHKTEIHVLKAVKDAKDAHISGLANALGVTKGAVSQIVGKLEKKGLVRKEQDDKNMSKLRIILTAKGEIAHNRHVELHMLFEEMVQKELAQYPLEYCKFMAEALGAISKSLCQWTE